MIGKATANYLGSGGLVSKSNASDYSFIFQTSLVKDPAWQVGDRVVLPDGRVYRYAKSVAACKAGYGVKFWGTLLFDGSTYAAAAAGAMSVQITADAGFSTALGADLAEDALRGGIITMGHGAVATTQTRGIIGNSAHTQAELTAGATVTVYLDAPLLTAAAAATFVELMDSPYAHLNGTDASDYVGYAGVPAVNVTATATYFWVQTWGPCWIVPGGGDAPGAEEYERMVYFVGDGSVNGAKTAIAIESGYQPAGFIIQRDSNGAGGPPWVMLQVSP